MAEGGGGVKVDALPPSQMLPDRVRPAVRPDTLMVFSFDKVELPCRLMAITRGRIAILGHPLYRILRLLEEQRLWYRIDRDRTDSIRLSVTSVGERLEIDVFEDEHVEFSRFKGDEAVNSNSVELYEIIHQFYR